MRKFTEDENKEQLISILKKLMNVAYAIACFIASFGGSLFGSGPTHVYTIHVSVSSRPQHNFLLYIGCQENPRY